MKDESDSGGLQPQYYTYGRQKCFLGHSQQAAWYEDILSALAAVLPVFDMDPWYAADHFEPTKTLRNKVVELIANARYGIYDLSSWQDKNGRWHQPRNVFIELGMAIVLNRPTLLLRHTSNNTLPLPDCLQGIELLAFAGETTLIKALRERLPQWVNAPEREWQSRFCLFGNRDCDFREAHPQARHWGQDTLHCHLADGLDETHPAFTPAEHDEIRGCFEAVLERYDDVTYLYLDELSLAEGYQFHLCSHCQAVRSTPFAIYHVTPQTPAQVFITLGMSIALEKVFAYEIPKVLLVRRESDLPSLLRGYDVVEVGSSSEMKKKLKAFVPKVTRQVRETVWVGRPLPFIEYHSPLLPEQLKQEDATSGQTGSSSAENEDEMIEFIEAKLLEKIFGANTVFPESLGSMGTDRQLERRKRLSEAVENSLEQLTPRESRILRLRYGLQDGHQRTLKEVGEMFGLSGERIRQIESEALRKLRHPVVAGKLIVFLGGEVDETENNSFELRIGIPPRLLAQLRQTLRDCGPLGNNREVHNIFVDARLSPWLKNLPEADTLTGRVEAIIAYLHDKHQADTGENALVLLLHILRDRTDPSDACHQRLASLAGELRARSQRQEDVSQTEIGQLLKESREEAAYSMKGVVDLLKKKELKLSVGTWHNVEHGRRLPNESWLEPFANLPRMPVKLEDLRAALYRDELSVTPNDAQTLRRNTAIEAASPQEALKIMVFDPATQQWASETTFSIPPPVPNKKIAQEIGFDIRLTNAGNSSAREPVIEMNLTSSTDAFWKYGYQDRKALVVENAPREWRINNTYDRLEFEGGADFVCHGQGQRYLGTVKMMVPYGQPETTVTFHYRIQAEGYRSQGSFSAVLKPEVGA